MKAQKDGDKGTWKIQFYYRDWQGVNKKKYKRGFKTKGEAENVAQQTKVPISRTKTSN